GSRRARWPRRAPGRTPPPRPPGRPRARSRAATRGACGASTSAFPRERVTHAAHGADEAGIELAAQRMDVHFHRVARDLLVPAVEPLLELRAREVGAGTVRERLEQGVLARRGRHLPALAPHAPRR